MPSNSTSANRIELNKIEILKPNDELNDYNPFDHRIHDHQTTDLETLAHILKGAVGAGILSLPYAFANCGLWNGLFLSFAIGGICLYCIQMLIKNSHILCRRVRLPFLDYADIVHVAFSIGPSKLKNWSKTARIAINASLIASQFGICCVYNVFIAKNIKNVLDVYEMPLNIRYYMVIFTVPLILLNLIRNLKLLAKFSMFSIILLGFTLAITLYYIFTDLPSISERPAFVSITKWPLFIGTMISAIEGVGVVVPLENKMKNPSHMIGWKGVLTYGWGLAIAMYALFGFLGYWRFGDELSGSITLNLPIEDKMAQAVKVVIAIAILFTYPLQMYVVFSIVWKSVQIRIPAKHQMFGEMCVRIGLVILSTIVSIIIPLIGPFVSLVGAVGLSSVGLIFPPFIEIIVNWEQGFGRYHWQMWKDAFFFLFGIFAFLIGTYTSIQEIADELGKVNESSSSNSTVRSVFDLFSSLDYYKT